jgi:hypothetical protein
MNKHAQDLYVGEIRNQAILALQATDTINECIRVLEDKSRPWAERSPYMSNTFRAIHSFLTHASNISKLFRPVVQATPPTKAEKLKKWQRTTDRGVFLRALYTIQSPHIFENRDLRNHLEHFDERLDEFAEELDASTTGKAYADMGIGPIATMFNGIRPDFILRHYETTGVFIFRGIDYDLMAIERGVSEVVNKSTQLLA